MEISKNANKKVVVSTKFIFHAVSCPFSADYLKMKSKIKKKTTEIHLIAEGSTVCMYERDCKNKSAKLPRFGARDKCERPDTGSRH